MGVAFAPKPFEIFLASLMSESEAAELYRQAGWSLEEVADMRASEEAAGFWAPASMSYFEQRLPLSGIDDSFVVAQPVELGTRRHRFTLSSWAEFELGVLSDSAGVPFYPHFVRCQGTVVTPPTDLRAIRPWSATIEEVMAWVGAPLVDDSWDLRRWLTYAIASEEWTITFDLGLVQTVHRKTDAT